LRTIEGAVDTQVFDLFAEHFLAPTLIKGDIALTKRKLNNALAKAIKMISVDDICGWFAHCGYVFSFI
jgi:hypothetical protein